MDEPDIEKLSELARIGLSASDEEALRGKLSDILSYVATIQEVAPADDEARKSTGFVETVLREDAEPHAPGIHTEALLAEAPVRSGDYLKVKKIL